MPKDKYTGRYWFSEEAGALDSSLDIDSALAAFDRSKWKHRVNKILIDEADPPSEPFPDRPLNRFR